MSLKANWIFVNLAIKDIAKTRSFFERLWFEFNEKFSNDKALSLVIWENMYAMLLLESYFETFTDKTLCDTTKNTELLLAISVDSREQVDSIMTKALEAWAKEPRPPQDHWFMYLRDLEDLDGHTWEIFWMDESQMPAATEQ